MYDTYPSPNGVDLDLDSDLIDVDHVAEVEEDIELSSQNEIDRDIDHETGDLSDVNYEGNDTDLQFDIGEDNGSEKEIKSQVHLLDSEDDIDNLEELEYNTITAVTNEADESREVNHRDVESEESEGTGEDDQGHDGTEEEGREGEEVGEGEQAEIEVNDHDDEEQREELAEDKPTENGEVSVEETKNNPPIEEQAISSEDNSPDKVHFQFPIIVNISDENEYTLIPFSGETSFNLSELEPIFDTSVLSLSLEELFESLRGHQELVDMHDIRLSDEMVLSVTELGNLSITEDNVYTKEITVDDLLKAFTSLVSNSTKNEKLPKKLTFAISTQTRFITKFNHLSECITLGKGFEDIQNYAASKSERTHEQSESNNRGEEHSESIYKGDEQFESNNGGDEQSEADNGSDEEIESYKRIYEEDEVGSYSTLASENPKRQKLNST